MGPNAALLAIDLFNLAYAGGDAPVAEADRSYPGTCGSAAWAAIPATVRLFDSARRAGLPVIYTTNATETPARGFATRRDRSKSAPVDDPWGIRTEFTPRAEDVVIRKQRASAFFGTPLEAQLRMLHVESLIVCGETTSGCVRASAVDAYSHGFHVTIAEECVYDRSELSHKVNLFDLHHKYADVMHAERILAHLESLTPSA